MVLVLLTNRLDLGAEAEVLAYRYRWKGEGRISVLLCTVPGSSFVMTELPGPGGSGTIAL